MLAVALALVFGGCGSDAPLVPTSPATAPRESLEGESTEELDGGLEAADAAVEASPAGGFLPPVIRLPVDAEAELNELVTAALANGAAPGCVILLGRRDGVVFRRAYGQRALSPTQEAMTEDTIFDLASVTKGVATATAVMQLVEAGRVRLDAPVARYLPAFGRRGKRRVTVRQLLTHSGGLPAVNPLRDYADGPAAGLSAVLGVELSYAPGQGYRYSDLDFIVLGALVAEVSGEALDEYVARHIFEPLAMDDTRYRPAPGDHARVAPTEERDGAAIRGIVDDPRAYRLGGVAGNAGLFSTADDLARYARAMLGGGSFEDARILSETSVATMTTATTLPNGARRGLGWDMSRRTAQGLSLGSYGHGGYTGTWLWIDPSADLFVIVLSNRVHQMRGDVRALRLSVAQLARRALPRVPSARPAPVATGIDVLRREDFARLDGARVGLITNTSGRARDGRTTLSLLNGADNVTLSVVFAPEHGLDASREGSVHDGRLGPDGPRVYSLFGRTRSPPPEALEGLDALVFDVQDVGTRFYTYLSTMRRAMEAAAAAGVRFVVLDRPDPLGGTRVEGPLVDESHTSFVNHHALPIVHGMTAGEMARLLADARHIDVRLEVVEAEGWQRGMRYDETGLRWVPPSPNLRTPTEVALYPAVGLLESTNVSVGRGTSTPFEVLGAPFVDASALARYLDARPHDGVRFTPTRFTPRARPHRGVVCHGLRLEITNAETFSAVATGLLLAQALRAVHREEWDLPAFGRMLANDRALAHLGAGDELMDSRQRDELDVFRALRQRHLIYD